jgi:hypothetical protein
MTAARVAGAVGVGLVAVAITFYVVEVVWGVLYLMTAAVRS